MSHPSQRPHQTPQWKRNLTILWITQFLAMAGMNLIVPFLPFFIRDLGVSGQEDLALWSGLVFAAPFMTAFLATPVWGVLGDRYGRKIMVVRAIFGLAVSQILVGFAGDVYQLFLFRLFQGLISGYIAASLALVSTSTPPEKMGYALGFLQSSTAGGLVLGPAIGGILADFISYNTIFYIIAVLCFAGGFAIIFLVRELHTTPAREHRATVFDNARHVLKSGPLRTIAISIMLAQTSALMIEPIFALFVEQFRTDIKYLSTIVGTVFAVAGVFMVFAAPWWGRQNDKHGYRTNIVYATSATGLAYAAHIVIPDLYSLGFLRAGLGFARGGILHSLFSVMSLHTPAERRGGVMGIASSMAILGNSVGPILGGFVASKFGLLSVFGFNSALFLLIALMIWRSDIEPPRPHAGAKPAPDAIEAAAAAAQTSPAQGPSEAT